MTEGPRVAHGTDIGATVAESGETAWWALDAAEAQRRLETRDAGLTAAEAARRIERYGPNELAPGRHTSDLQIFVRQFQSPLIYILLVALVVTLVLREFVDAAVIALVLVLDVIVGFVQERRAERAAEALRRMTVTQAKVLRDGHERVIPATALVPGDAVLLEAGDRVPADCLLLRVAALETDESALTGESTPVTKMPGPVPERTPAADRHNFVYMGTIVTRGRGRALVVRTGAATELGGIAESVEEIVRADTPLQRRIASFSRLIAIAIGIAGVVGGAAGIAAGQAPSDIFLMFVALSIAAIPEGLPVVLTVTLAVGVNRMSRRNVIIRRLPAVETLGNCTVIATDKTGTLTQNRMTVQHVVAGGRRYDVRGHERHGDGAISHEGRDVNPGDDDALRLTLLVGALCNDASLLLQDGYLRVNGDPTEAALLVSAARGGILKDEAEDEYPRIAEVPFDPERRWAATVNRFGDEERLLVKGAPEAVLAMCDSAHDGGPLDADALLETAEELAAGGMRVLAMAYRSGAPRSFEAPLHHVRELRFAGMQAMMDPPREEAREAVRACQDGGMRVLMVTGDHATTALAIARDVGIARDDDGAVTGADLDSLDDDAFARTLDQTPVYARVSPQHKHRIVATLQARGEVVAVTGDGVNDAPALKAADIGAAMGRTGTDVAKEAADMVVVDDNFASIVAAVAEGRIAFDNIRKVTFFLIVTGVGTVLAVLASVMLDYRIPLLPAQLLWLNLVTNGVQDVALAFEPGERGILRRKPRSRDEGIISPLLWERTAIAGAVMALGTMALYVMEVESGSSAAQARTVALTTLVFFQVFHIGNSRSEYLSAFAKNPLSNPLLFVGTAVAVAIHVAALYVPATQYILRVEPLSIEAWVRIIPVAFSVIVVIEAHKLARGGIAAFTGREAP